MKLVIHRAGRRAPYELKAGDARVPLSEAQGTIILALLGNPYLRLMDLAEIVWADPDDMPDQWLVALRCRVWKLNRKLARMSARIVWRQDIYRLVETDPERIAA